MAQELVIETIRWMELPHLGEVATVGLEDFACLAELEQVLLRHGAADRFGIHLLHRSFEISSDEVLVERVDPDRRTATTTVHSRTEFQGPPTMIETHWRLGSGGFVCQAYACNRVICSTDQDKRGTT